jgi:heme exporter protein C
MKKFFPPLLILTTAMFAYAPVMIANAPYESTMLLVQKIFYFHVPSWIAMGAALAVCGAASAIYLFKGHPAADRLAVSAAELVVLFGAFGLVTGPLWARKAWGVYWPWDPRTVTALLLWLIFVAYLLFRKYGGPGSDKLAAGLGLFGMANAPFVYKSVDWWRTIHPKTTVVTSLGTTAPEMYSAFLYCSVSFLLLFCTLLIARVQLETQRAELDRLYLELEDEQ